MGESFSKPRRGAIDRPQKSKAAVASAPANIDFLINENLVCGALCITAWLLIMVFLFVEDKPSIA